MQTLAAGDAGHAIPAVRSLDCRNDQVLRCSKLGAQGPRSRAPAGAQQYSASTKRALVDVAEELFTEHGYAATSLDAIVAGARVTKGALYHHFSGKQALFEAVFERVETDAAETIQKALKGQRDPWEKALAGLRAFLEVVQEPRYRRIVIQEGPAVLGYERYREQEERSTFAIVLDIVRSVLGAGDVGARRGDAADLRPDLLRRDVVGRRVRLHRRGPGGGRRPRRGRDRLHPRRLPVAGRRRRRAAGAPRRRRRRTAS